MTLKQYSKQLGVHYRTAWNYYKQGLIPRAYQLPTGTIIVPDTIKDRPEYVAIYARVSSSQNKSNLETQSDRLVQYCIAKGYQVDKVIKEIGSGVNDNRKQLLDLLTNEKITRIVVEHKDRLSRFGYNYIKELLALRKVEIEIVNNAANDKEDLIQDLISIVTSMCARYYGLRRTKRKTEQLIKELMEDETKLKG